MYKGATGEEIYTVCVDGRKLQARKGELVSEVLQKNGFNVTSPCGGRGACGKCAAETAELGRILCCATQIDRDLTILKINLQKEICSDSGITTVKTAVTGEDATCAVDLGTTTIAVALCDNAGEVVDISTFNNPNIEHGADVISRIQYAAQHGTETLQKPLLREIASRLSDIMKKHNVSHIRRLCISGNTTMLHIFWGEDCTSLGQYPYTPIFTDSRCRAGLELGMSYATEIVSLPPISAFVGGDIVSGLSTLPPPSSKNSTLYIDLGTNAEVVLYDGEKYLATATAAGPCFEGGNISCGMSATDGAITHFSVTDGVPSYTVVGKEPRGLCGTGIIDVAAELVVGEKIDDTGLLHCEDGYEVATGVVFTQGDVRELQLAKSAVRAGMEILIRIAKLTYDDISAVMLAGGFSSGLNVMNAAIIGLIPVELCEKCKIVGNASLRGAIKALSQKDTAEVDAIAAKSRVVDLNEEKDFFERFIKYLNFRV